MKLAAFVASVALIFSVADARADALDPDPLELQIERTVQTLIIQKRSSD